MTDLIILQMYTQLLFSHPRLVEKVIDLFVGGVVECDEKGDQFNRIIHYPDMAGHDKTQLLYRAVNQ